MKVRYVRFSADEWLAGTERLSLEERGAFITICALIYSKGGPIDDDERWLARNLGCHWRSWRALRNSLLALGKIQTIPAVQASNGSLVACAKLTNRRCEFELIKARTRSRTASGAVQERLRKDRLRRFPRA